MTNKGLQLYVHGYHDLGDGSNGRVDFALNCKRSDDESQAPVIELEPFKASVRWRRVNSRELKWDKAPPGTQACGKAPTSIPCEPLFVHQAR